MGKRTFSRTAFKAATTAFVPEKGPVTRAAEQQVYETGKLNPLVDPAGYGVIRYSRPRLDQQDDGLWVLNVGTPMPIETRVDTTGSMGNNVDIAMSVLPTAYECCKSVLPDYDLQIATGIFGDVCDQIVLCRPQFEMEAEKIVEQLTLMVPLRKGGDNPEDPHYGLFGAAYLTAAYIVRIGLKGYDFTVSDAPARDRLDERQLLRIFGDEVFEKVAANGHQIDRNDLPTTKDVVKDLLRITHAFFLQVGGDPDAQKFWTRIFGKNRVVELPSTELLPQVQAAIIGLTEGTLELGKVKEFLCQANVGEKEAKQIARSVANIPLGAQAALPNYSRRPQAGDLFKEKADLWPVGHNETASGESAENDEGKNNGPEWL
jgi:hypothetical protein